VLILPDGISHVLVCLSQWFDLAARCVGPLVSGSAR
jgi:hypothetical protein